MQQRPSEGNIVSPLPTDSVASFLGYMQRRFSEFVASDAAHIPALLREHQPNANDEDPSSALVNNDTGPSRTTFDTLDVITQRHFSKSLPLRRAG